ncbi:MAG: NAD(P) transhydrogenase subunit alpha, partial [Mailhella sp.]|nr:NAD(P) transhydrogenase subunit alpha [Mailhella sp.]
MSTFVLVLVFAASLVVGYKVLSHIPSLLHTPLMSSMNALDGVI